jgi:hypothetical protein
MLIQLSALDVTSFTHISLVHSLPDQRVRNDVRDADWLLFLGALL